MVIDFYEQTPFAAGCWFYSPPRRKKVGDPVERLTATAARGEQLCPTFPSTG